MKSWWLGLSARERLAVAAGAAFIALATIVLAVVQPVVGWRAAAIARAETAERDYRLVYRSAALAPIARPSDTDADVPVRNLLNDAARRHDVTLTFVNAFADGSVEMQAGPVPSERVFEMLAALERDDGVRVVTADIARASSDAGSVRIQATLAR